MKDFKFRLFDVSINDLPHPLQPHSDPGSKPIRILIIPGLRQSTPSNYITQDPFIPTFN